MNSSRPGASTVVAFGLLTLAITVVRLVMELNGTAPKDSGGALFWLGISWLPPLVGFVLGRQLMAAGQAPPSRRRALVWPLGLFFLAIAIVILNFGFYLREGSTHSFVITVTIGACAWMTAAFVAARTWPALARLTFAYGLWARVGVIAVTLLCLMSGWTDTHYTRFGPDQKPLLPTSNAQALLYAAFAQLFLWVPMTVLTGAIGGGIAAYVTRRGPVAAA